MSLPSARSIAFNRRLRASWLEEGLRLRLEGIDEAAWLERMEEVVRVETKGRDSVKKSMRYLRHIWTDASGEDDLRTAAIDLYRASSDKKKTAIVLSWGMAIATYPFLLDVAATLGRMFRVQQEVKLEQLLRKLTETHGEKETVRRSGRYSLSLIQDMGFVERSSPGCYQLLPSVKIKDAEVSSWLLRAWFRATGQVDPVDRVSLSSHPGLAFFDAAALVSDGLQTGTLVLERLSYSQDTVRIA
jgi:hypothetical protein